MTCKESVRTEYRGRRFLLRLVVGVVVALTVALTAVNGNAAKPATEAEVVRQWDRSYWLHASLGRVTQRNYWGPNYPRTEQPTREQVTRAARLLTGEYGANRLFLMYHRELPDAEAREVFRWWREACPETVELIPTFVLRMYDREQTPVFARDELLGLCRFLKHDLGMSRAGVYDVLPGRDQGPALEWLTSEYPNHLVRVGLQPGEVLTEPYVAAVQDTWSGFCHGKTHADWHAPGAGRDTLRKWVDERNQSTLPVSWDLIVVAWDYAVTKHGEYPGYDDAEKNMALPDGRNRLALREILSVAKPERFWGVSSDLYILQANSFSPRRDGPANSFYETLKRGEAYNGYFAAPLREITGIYRQLREGRL